MKKVMMTVFKIVLILIAVVVVGVVALILFALHKESNYYKYTEAVGEIEQKYTAFGDKEVSCQEYDANDDVIGKYAVWYPSELESSNTQYCDFPSEHWTRIRTNNVIERLNREIRRRTRVVGSFPDGNSALMLVCARLRHVAGSQWGNKKYMNMKHLEAAIEDASIAG